MLWDFTGRKDGLAVRQWSNGTEVFDFYSVDLVELG